MNLSKNIQSRLLLISLLSVFLPEAAKAAIISIYAVHARPTENAFFDRATGNGGAKSVLTWQQFKNDVEEAAIHNLGGVINFEHGSDLFSATLIRPVINNVLGFEISGSNFQTRSLATLVDQDGPFPSGTFVLSSSVGTRLGNEFRFTSFDFTAHGLLLTQVGFTIIGDVFDNIVQAEITAGFSGGGSVTLDSNLRSRDNDDRIFYGFEAPEGEAITSINSNFGGSRVVILDDFGFVAVPEPGAVSMLTIGVATKLIRRRRTTKVAAKVRNEPLDTSQPWNPGMAL